MHAIHSSSSLDASRAGRALGAMIFSFFGAVLLEVWDLRSAAGPLAFFLTTVLGLALLGAAWRRYRRYAPALAQQPETAEKLRGRRIFNLVNIGQWVVILVLGNVFANIGLGQWVVPMAMVVIGLHFVPLAHVFRNRAHYLLAAGMVGFALAYPQLAAAGPADPIGFLGAGLMLWTSALWALRDPAKT